MISKLEAAPGAQFMHTPAHALPKELPEEDPDVRGGGVAYDDKRT